MTKDDKAQVNAWVSILIAGLSVMIAAGGVVYYAWDTNNARKCNDAYAYAQNKAQSERIPFSNRQNLALRRAFEQLPALAAQDPAAVPLLLQRGSEFVTAAKEYEEARNLYPYPSSSCPEVEGITS